LAGELLITAPRVVPGMGEPAILEPGYVLVTDGRVAEVGGGTPHGGLISRWAPGTSCPA
jgi:hypothetical protein